MNCPLRNNICQVCCVCCVVNNCNLKEQFPNQTSPNRLSVYARQWRAEWSDSLLKTRGQAAPALPSLSVLCLGIFRCVSITHLTKQLCHTYLPTYCLSVCLSTFLSKLSLSFHSIEAVVQQQWGIDFIMLLNTTTKQQWSVYFVTPTQANQQ